VTEDEIAPQSSFVAVADDGWCLWAPFFPRSVSHCSVVTTWFPFDEQRCDLIYESWKYNAQQFSFITDIERLSVNDTSGIKEHDFLPSAS